MAIYVCYWANYVNEKIKLRWCTCTTLCSPTVRNAKIKLQNNTYVITSTTHPNLSFYFWETYKICNFLASCCDCTRKQYKTPISLSPEVYETSSKTGSRIRILYLLTGPIVFRQVSNWMMLILIVNVRIYSIAAICWRGDSANAR